MGKRKIGIIGGGNLGSVLAVRFSQKNDVVLYTNLIDRVQEYQKDMVVFCEDTNSYITGNIKSITSSLKELTENSEYIFITFPSFLFKQLAVDLVPLLNNKHHLVFVPGSGGAELAFRDAIKKGATITGLQRVHAVARIIEFGKTVRESGLRPSLRIASIPSSFNHEAAQFLSKLYGVPIEELDNYLNNTLINSNPILHTSRLYSIFHEYPAFVKEYDSLPLFYEEWNIESARLLIKMDDELFSIFDKLELLGLPVKQVKRITHHYDSDDAIGLMNKLKSIQSFKGLKTPGIINEKGKYIPDFKSRYFTADFPFGLDIIRAFARFLNIDVPNMDKASKWYRDASGDKTQFFDLKDYDILSKNDLLNFYK